MPRMKILNTVEQEAFDMSPVFNSDQRKRFFDFPLKIRHLAANLRTLTDYVSWSAVVISKRLNASFLHGHSIPAISGTNMRDVGLLADI